MDRGFDVMTGQPSADAWSAEPGDADFGPPTVDLYGAPPVIAPSWMTPPGMELPWAEQHDPRGLYQGFDPLTGLPSAGRVIDGFSGAAPAPQSSTLAPVKTIPQRQYDPDKKMVWQGGQWVDSRTMQVVVQALSGAQAMANSPDLKAEIVDWSRYDPFTKQLKGYGVGWFTTSPADHPVWIRLPDGRVVSPDCITAQATDPDGKPLTFAQP